MKNVIAALSAGLVLGCQTYDFENVTPMALSQESHVREIKANSLKPNIMLLVDNSGSMTDPVATGGTRISNLKSAMGGFFTDAPDVARFGLTVFPENSGPSQTVRVALPPGSNVDDGAVLEANADEVSAAIQALVPNGGTPTNASLAFVGGEPGLNADDGRRDFVLLLTDGVPNLNPANPNAICDCGTTCSQARQNACACTQGSCDSPGLCSAGCLDRDATVDTIAALHSQKNIDTIVIGFGADLGTGVATDTLNAMAIAGAQPCTSCATSFYQAGDAAELQQVLSHIINIFDRPCEQTLDERPSDPRYISVLVNDVTLEAGPETYSYDGDRTITLEGATCAQAENSTPQNPVRVAIRAVEKL